MIGELCIPDADGRSCSSFFARLGRLTNESKDDSTVESGYDSECAIVQLVRDSTVGA